MRLRLSLLVLSLCLAIGHATTITINNAGANGDASATAVFTNLGSQMKIQLTDTTVNPSGVAENLSAFQFVLSGVGFTLDAAASGTPRTVNNNNTFATGGWADGAGISTASGIGWVFSTSGNTYTLDVLTGAGHAGPANTLIGTPGADTAYSNAGGSIAGNGPHNPFLANTTTFFVDGINSDTRVTSALFQFGTTDGNLQACTSGPGCSSQVPEPVSLAMVGGGLVAIGLVGRRLSDPKIARDR